MENEILLDQTNQSPSNPALKKKYKPNNVNNSNSKSSKQPAKSNSTIPGASKNSSTVCFI
jgi:hypothetical protein